MVYLYWRNPKVVLFQKWQLLINADISMISGYVDFWLNMCKNLLAVTFAQPQAICTLRSEQPALGRIDGADQLGHPPPVWGRPERCYDIIKADMILM